MSHALVACGEENDKDEREDEGDGSSDAPLAEDNAEVFRGPSKDHLNSIRSANTTHHLHTQSEGETCVHATLIPHVHITMTAMAVIHIVHSMHRMIHRDW